MPIITETVESRAPVRDRPQRLFEEGLVPFEGRAVALPLRAVGRLAVAVAAALPRGTCVALEEGDLGGFFVGSGRVRVIAYEAVVAREVAADLDAGHEAHLVIVLFAGF